MGGFVFTVALIVAIGYFLRLWFEGIVYGLSTRWGRWVLLLSAIAIIYLAVTK